MVRPVPRASSKYSERAMRTAAQKLGLDGLATPHVLRHCWASHVLAAGENIRAVQEQLGHKSLETTMIYVHARGAEVRSPLDRLPTNVLPFPGQSHAASSARIASDTPGKARA
jgi:site-specific recombinase XerD